MSQAPEPRRSYQTSLLFDCARLRCIRYTTSPADIMVTYAGNVNEESRKSALRVSKDDSGTNPKHPSTILSKLFEHTKQPHKYYRHLLTERSLPTRLFAHMSNSNTGFCISHPHNGNRSQPPTKGCLNQNLTIPPKTASELFRTTSFRHHGPAGRSPTPSNTVDKELVTQTTVSRPKTAEAQPRTPPPHYSEIAPHHESHLSENSATTHFQTPPENVTEGKVCLNTLNPPERWKKWWSYAYTASCLVELTIETWLLRWELSLLKEQGLVLSEKGKSQSSVPQPPATYIVHQTIMSSMPYSQFMETHPTVALPAATTAEEHDLGGGNPTWSSESEFTHPPVETTVNRSTQGIKRKPFNANDAPTFTGNSVTEFLEALEDYCHDRAIPMNDCIARVPRQCTIAEVKEIIEDLPSYEGGDWMTFRTALLEEFEDEDPKQFRHTEDYLRTLKLAEDVSADKLEAFCNKWEAAERALIEKGKRSMPELTLVLLGLLPTRLLQRVAPGTNIDRKKADTLRTGRLLSNLRKEAEKRRCFEKVSPDTIKKDRHVAFVKDSSQERPVTQLVPRITASAPEPSPSALAESRLPPALRTTASTIRPPYQPSPEIEDLSKQFAAFSMGFNRFGQILERIPDSIQQAFVNQTSVPRAPAAPSQNFAPQGSTNNYAPNNGWRQTNPNAGPPPNRPMNCIYCGVAGHFKSSCDIMYSDQKDGWIHLIDGRVHDGPEGSNGQQIDVRGLNGAGLRQRVSAVRNPAPIVTTSMKSISAVFDYADYYESENGRASHQAYVSDDELPDTSSDGEVGVYAARVEKRKDNEGFNSLAAKETVRKRVAKEAKLPATRNKLSNSGWKPLVEAKDSTMIDEGYVAPPVPTRTEDKVVAKTKTAPRQTWLQSKMAEQSSEHFLEKVLKGAKMDLSVWDLLSHSPTLQDLIFKKYLVPLDKPSVRSLREAPTIVRSSLINVADDGRVSYLEDCPKISVKLGEMEDAHLALIDTGAEPNVLTTGLVDAGLLPVSLGTTLVMKSHTGHLKKFVGVAENVPVTIGSLTVLAHFFILEDAEQEIVLGNPFIKAAQITFRYDARGNQWATLADRHGDEIEVLASKPRTREQQAAELRIARGKGRQV